MTMLTKIGNSKGVRIPKAFIAQAHLDDAQIEFEVLENGLLLKPVKKSARVDWEENIKEVLQKNKNKKDDSMIDEFLNDSDLEDFQW